MSVLAYVVLSTLGHSPIAYNGDSGAVAANQVTSHPDWTPKVDLAHADLNTWTAWYHDVWAILEHALPGATAAGREVDEVNTHGPQILWCPYGNRDTLLPPAARDQRIFCADLRFAPDLSSAPLGISFVSQAEGDQLAASHFSFGSSPPPGGYPPDYLYTLRPADTNALLCAVFTGPTDCP